MIGTYMIINRKTGKYYYGSSNDIERRFMQHKSELKRGIHHCIYLQRAYNKYGHDSFIFKKDIVCETLDKARFVEQLILDCSKNLYNTSKYASGGDTLSNHPNRSGIVAKMKQASQKRYANMTTEDRKKMSDIQKGKKRSEALKKKLSDIHKGKKHSEETRKKMSKIQTEHSSQAINIIIDNIDYSSVTKASKQLNIPISTICYRLKNTNYPNYTRK